MMRSFSNQVCEKQVQQGHGREDTARGHKTLVFRKTAELTEDAKGASGCDGGEATEDLKEAYELASRLGDALKRLTPVLQRQVLAHLDEAATIAGISSGGVFALIRTGTSRVLCPPADTSRAPKHQPRALSAEQQRTALREPHRLGQR